MVEKVAAEGISRANISIKMQTVYCRLKGQDAALDVPFDRHFTENFKAKYQSIYGHWIANREIEIESIRVIACEIKKERISAVPNFKFQISHPQSPNHSPSP